MSNAISVGEVRVGAHYAYWGTSTASDILLGLTDDGDKLIIEHEDYEIKTEEFGDMPVETVRLGERATCALMLKQFENTQLKIAIPGSVDGTGTAVTSWNFGRQAGVVGSSEAKRLRLHPFQIVSSNTTDDVVLHKAVVIKGPFEVEFRNRKERMFGVTFLALPDLTKADGKYLGYWKVDS